MNRIVLQNLAPGFQDPQIDSQRVFRSALQALARPGQVQLLERLPEPPAPLGGAAVALALALLDLETPIWLSEDLRGVTDYLTFHTGAPSVASIGAASFVLVGDGNDLPDLSAIHLGDAEYPERAATLIVQVQHLQAGLGKRLHGPGINGHIDIAVEGIADAFWDALRLNRRRFPLGFDTFLVTERSVLGLPRTVICDAQED